VRFGNDVRLQAIVRTDRKRLHGGSTPALICNLHRIRIV
jgi:hypothetical protein